jgi:hypothetical protein
MFTIIKVFRNKTFQMFYGKFADQIDNQIDSPNRYNVEGNNSLSLGRLKRICQSRLIKITWFLKTNQWSVIILPVNFYIAFLYDYKKLFGLIIVLVQSSSLSFDDDVRFVHNLHT